MPPPAPPLPTKFPCWCKAVYSWGGETKRDLGFIEGDLIECLNAGDGQWWMGRLRRDRRAVGLFPSNFVELLDESLWPGAPRGPGVNGVSRSGTNAAAQKPLPQKQKSTFRKPFQAYYNAGQPNPVAHAREKQEKTAASGHSDSQRRHKPYSSMKHAKPPGPSPNPSPRNSVDSVARVPPLPERNASNLRNRAPSPLPPRQEYGHYRAVSPAPPQPADFRQQQNSSHTEWSGNAAEAGGLLGGLTSPKPKRTGFFKKMISSARANAANARNTISSSPSRPNSRGAGLLPNGVTSIAGGSAVFHPSGNVAKEMGMGGSVDWVQVRRDINRSNSLSKNERIERAERCQMNDIAVINPIEVLLETIEGDEGLDGLPVPEPLDFSQCNLGLVDKNTRFIQGLPPTTTPVSLAQGYVCRPYRSDVQRLRAIFTWVSERIAWEEDYEGDVDTRRVIQSKRGCSEEIAVLVMDMCAAVGLHSEVIRGYLKAPGEELDFEMVAHPNHWWNAVIVDGEWRIMDCSLANPTNPRRSAYSSAGSQVAESGFFLARPSEICYTHVPLLPEAQHIIPPISHEVLMALPCACPPYFMNDIEIADFDTSLLSLENLEMAHIHFFVPEDVEAVAEVEARIFARDGDGDVFESGDVCRKRALCQPEWIGGRKRYTVKAVLPGDEGHATLKVYAGKKGLMHSIKSNPHPLVFGLPLTHIGQNPPYDFLTLHPTPHAQRHDLYVAQPQCARLAVNNTFVFAVRQHPSSLTWTHSPPSNHAHSQSTSSAMLGGRVSPNPFARPTSALSMVSASASNAGSIFSASSSGSDPLNPSSRAPPGASQKPAKLAIQSPSGKIIRLMRKSEHMIASSHGAGVGGASDGEKEGGDGSVWETIIKIGERGTWRGLVLADRSARWCVFAEWESF
ncbi:hypothetical protein SLS58_003579 [Diplodia intermedia]|uniref:SH3 domain-containing protein n=1 Tax=Diplodia intermedia TaxID=856260 RepID=A0ABR3TVM5_9PEZI